LRILVACERSGVVREAFAQAGWEAWSCDLQETIEPGNHYKGDVRDILYENWDFVIAHPPCTYLTVTGNKWFLPQYADRFPNRKQDRKEAIEFFMLLTKLRCAYAIENPVGIMSRIYRKPNQIIHPFYFGDPHSKKTCLWLNGVPNLKRETYDVEPIFHIYKDGRRDPIWHYESMRLPAIERMNIRSQTFQGVANAMVSQWGAHLTKRAADVCHVAPQQTSFL
jgi:hypothetical protein